MPDLAILIGQAPILRRLERQLDLLSPRRPGSLGWILTDDGGREPGDPVLGGLNELEALIGHSEPSVALVSLPAAMVELTASIRTRLRRLGTPDRFMPTLEDLVAGVGPRSILDIDLGGLLDRPARRIDEAALGAVVHGRRVLITGAGGTIGGELARIVAAGGPESIALMDRSENALFEIDRQIARRAPTLARHALLHDVLDAEGTLAHCRRLRPDLVFHAAAHKHVPMMEEHPGAAVDNNLFGTRAIADAADAAGVERFVMISTDKAVNPSSVMGATKRLAELYVQDLNQRSDTMCSIVRFGNVLGSSGSALEIWSKQIADGGPLTVTHPEMTRYFMTIPEAAALVIESAGLVDRDAGEVFLLDMGEPVRVLDMAERFARRHGVEPVRGDAVRGDAVRGLGGGAGVVEVVFTGPRPGEKLHEELAFDAEAMRPTRHPDINIWLLPPPDAKLVRRFLTALDPTRRDPDPGAIAAAVRRFVPEMVRPVAA